MARILLADDDAAMLNLLGRALAADGHAVVIAHDGQDALDKAQAASQPFEILISDVQMPILDGISLAQQLLATSPNLRVVLMSGLQSEMARAVGTKAAASRFLLKPFTLEQARATVRDVLA
jgi:two-component system, cell cycle response regulator CpdR